MTFSKFLNPKNDVAFRKIFGSERNKGILIHFINDILELKDSSIIEAVEFLPTIQDPEIASKKESIVDVLCKDANGTQIIVEMQVAPTKGFAERAQYYAAKAYCRQLNRGSKSDGQYKNLKEVIFIAITDIEIFTNKKHYKSDHVTLDKHTKERDLKAFSFTFIELPKFNKTIDELTNIVEKWCYFFKHAESTSEAELEALIGGDLVIKQAYEALNRFNWTEEELFSYEEELKRLWDNQAALDYQLDKGVEMGRAEGLAEGIEKGIEKGIEATAINMLKKDLDLELISSITGLSKAEIQKLKY